jgi:tetratricopeptide (TPR) repeat protein
VLAAGVGALVVVYLGVRFVVQPDDGAALEQAASLAQQEGNAATAAVRFAELAEQASAGESRAAFLLEAAGAYEESGDLALALDTYARAVEAVAGTPGEPAVLLRQAAAMSHADLPEAAAERYEALLARIDLGPTQSAEALVGLAQIRGVATVAARQQALLDAAPTTEMRGSTALALADGWAAMGRLDLAREVLGRVLAAEGRADPSGTLRLRQAHFMAEDGAADQALALYTQLAPDSPEARLGAADLLARRGDDVAARTMLAPLLSVRTAFGARARNAAAEFALRAGDDAAATALLREVLGISDAEPRVRDDARILLARVLVTTDPTASDALVDANPTIRGALLLGQARSLRQAGKRGEARARWAAVAEDSTLDAETHVEAQMALAEMDVQDGAADSAVERYRGMSEGTLPDSARSRVQLGLANALVRVGRIQDAEVSYGALLQTSTAADVLAQAKLGLAHAADQRGQGERATRLLVEVGHGEGPWAFEALYELGQLRERAGDTTAGIEAYRLARTRAGVEADRRTAVSIALAQALERKGDPGAATLFAELLEAPDPLVRVAARLSVADGAVESDATRALSLYDAALGEAGPGEARARARAGWVRASVALGRTDAALTRLRAWLETESDSALRGELAVAAARALRAEGRASDAATLGERYGKDGGFELAMERAGALREIGRAAEAATALEGVRGASGDDEVWRTEARAEALLAAGPCDAAKNAVLALG